MKKSLLILSSLAAAMMLGACGNDPQNPNHQHIDANHDGFCDVCNAAGMIFEHKDENHDHLCDQCGKTLSEHVDANNDNKCDICNQDMSNSEEGEGEGHALLD